MAAHVQDAIDEVSALLTQTNRGVEDFTFDTRQELAESIEKPASSTPLSGALIAGISLIVGGILGLAATLGTTHLIKFTTDGASLPVFQTASVILSFAFAVLIGVRSGIYRDSGKSIASLELPDSGGMALRAIDLRRITESRGYTLS